MKYTTFKVLMIMGLFSVFCTFTEAGIDIGIDGQYDSANYDKFFDVGFVFDGGKTGTGKLALGTQSNGNQVLYYTVPKTFVDVSFGTTAIGWGSKHHNYKDLKGSDKLEFTIGSTAGTGSGTKVVYEFKDNVKEGGSVIAAAETSLKFDVELVGKTIDSFDDNGDSPALSGASPDYTDDSDANYLTSTNTDWIFDVAYEIEFLNDTFNDADWAAGDLDKLFVEMNFTNHKKDANGDKVHFDSFFGGHASPSKQAITSTTFTPNDPASAVPEPATVALLGIGLVGLAGAEVRRRRNNKAVDKS